MKVKLIGIPVLNQEDALHFYTSKLGFVVKHDIPLGGGNRWMTVVPQDEPDGVEVSLEPAPQHFEPAKVYQKSLFDAGIPYTQFRVDDVDAEFKRLSSLDVEFSMKPTAMETVKFAIFNDTCGNKIQIVEML